VSNNRILKPIGMAFAGIAVKQKRKEKKDEN